MTTKGLGYVCTKKITNSALVENLTYDSNKVTIHERTVLDFGNNSHCKAYSPFDGAILDKYYKVSQHDALSPT